MKKLIALILMSFLVAFVQGQSIDYESVPLATKTKFAKMYPNAKDFKWEKEQANYEAHFKENDTTKTAVFGPGGKFLQLEKIIPAANLPKGATDYLAKKLPGKKVKEASQITDAAGVVTYEAEVKEVDYIFDATGNFLKQEDDEE